MANRHKFLAPLTFQNRHFGAKSPQLEALCPTLSSDYFCLKYFGFVYDQSLQWKSSLDSVRHWSSNFFDYETGCLQCFLFGKQNNGTKTKICLSTFHQIQHNTFFEFGGKMCRNTDLLLIKKDLFEPKSMQAVFC